MTEKNSPAESSENPSDSQIEFREEALKQIAIPEEVNILFQPTTFPYWLFHWGLFATLLLAVLWLFLGSVPLFIQGRGIILSSQGVFSVQTQTAGIVTDIFVTQNETVPQGQLLARLTKPEDEIKYQNALAKQKELQLEVDTLQKQIHTELEARKTSFTKEISESELSIKDLEESIVSLQKEVALKERLYQEKLIGLNELYTVRQLLSERKIALAKTRGVLAQLQADLNKSYREEELQQKERDLLKAKHEVAIVKLSLHFEEIYSPYSGRVLEVVTSAGSKVNPGSVLFHMEFAPETKHQLLIYAYFPVEMGDKITLGEHVEVILSTVRREEYGALIGTVSEISPFPVSRDSMETVIRNPNLVDYLIQPSPSVIQVIVKPTLDSSTPSGFKWTSSRGPNMQITTGTVGEILTIPDRVSPLYYFFSLWRIEKWKETIKDYFHSN